jgi:hypothetical protein
MSLIQLHSSLQRFDPGQTCYEISGGKKLYCILKELTSLIPNLLSIIFDEKERLSPYVVIYIDGQDARRFEENYLVPDHAKIEILTSLVGG